MSPKKRDKIFKKLRHTAEDYIDCRLIIEKSAHPLDPKMLSDRLVKTVYVIAEHSQYEAIFADIGVVLDELWSYGAPYCCTGTVCFMCKRSMTSQFITRIYSYLLKR